MSVGPHALPPTSSLPPLRSLDTLSEDKVFRALRDLHSLYCPLPRSLDFRSRPQRKTVAGIPATPAVDSGYASGYEDEEDNAESASEALLALRSDVYERNFATRWLTVLVARAEELALFSEDSRQRAIDDACSVLSSFNDPVEEVENDEAGMTRDFSFALHPSLTSTSSDRIRVQLNDDPLKGDDPTDVGLQTWGAAIVLSDLMCSSPARFGLTEAVLGPSPRIVELGAGTGLVSLTLAALLPRIAVANAIVIATDYHPAVLTNLRANITTNFPSHTVAPVQTCLLDWATPSLDPPLDVPADMIIAADVVYEQEHAVMLRHCATRFLGPNGVFWLVASIRLSGRFDGIRDTVEAAFAVDPNPECENEPKLRILDVGRLTKRNGIGRSDEAGYKLFKIGWA